MKVILAHLRAAAFSLTHRGWWCFVSENQMPSGHWRTVKVGVQNVATGEERCFYTSHRHVISQRRGTSGWTRRR